MRFLIALACGMAASAAAQTVVAESSAAANAPSRQVLAEMGLADLDILSDAQASTIRGAGFWPDKIPVSPKMIWYKMGITNHREHVDQFKQRVSGRTSTKEIWYRKETMQFRSNVAKFKASTH